MVTSVEERQILQDMVHGLSAALHEQDREPENMNKLVLHKLLYTATQHIDLPVKFDLYQHGPMVNRSVFEEESLQPRPLSEIPSSTQPSLRNQQYPTPVDYASFFIENYYAKKNREKNRFKTDPAIRLYEKKSSPYGPLKKEVDFTQSLACQAILASVLNSGDFSSELSEEYKKGVRLALAASIGLAVGIPIGTLFNAITGLGIGITTTGVASRELSEFYDIKKRQEQPD